MTRETPTCVIIDRLGTLVVVYDDNSRAKRDVSNTIRNRFLTHAMFYTTDLATFVARTPFSRRVDIPRRRAADFTDAQLLSAIRARP